MLALIFTLLITFQSQDFTKSSTVKVYIDARIVQYMTARPRGYYDTIIPETTATGYEWRHRDYLRTEPRKGDVMITLNWVTLWHLRDLRETKDEMDEFDRAIRHASPVKR